jgi:hypothetical protein
MSWLTVKLVPLGQLSAAATVNIYVGDGFQLLRWLATVSCARIAFITHNHCSRFVPHAVGTSTDGALDPDTVRP